MGGLAAKRTNATRTSCPTAAAAAAASSALLGRHLPPLPLNLINVKIRSLQHPRAEDHHWLSVMTLSLAYLAAMAANPLAPNVRMADPHIHVFDGKVWMYAGKGRKS